MNASLTTMAAAVVFAWAIWCIFSRHVNDGIIGKIIYSFMAFAAFGVATNCGPERIAASFLMNWGVALLALRQVSIRYVWPTLRRHFVPCEHCPQRRAGDL